VSHDDKLPRPYGGSVPEHEKPDTPVDGDPVRDPGLPEHTYRLTDKDPKSERRAERYVAGMFGLAILLLIGFLVAFVVFGLDGSLEALRLSNLALGLTFGGALFLIGAGAVQWARKLMADHEVISDRHDLSSSPENTRAAAEAFQTGTAESGFGRRPLIRNTLLGSLALLPLPVVFLLRDLGPLPGTTREYTIWDEGVRVVHDRSFEPIRPEELNMGSLVNAMPATFDDLPHDGPDRLNSRAKSPVILVRMPPEDVTPYDGRENWAVDGILGYSKICTHVGCPISLYEQDTHHLLCPCHQSTFDLSNNGRVIFGPAARDLPQLPLMVDSEGYLVAQSDFTEPVGPSYWERDEYPR